MANNRMYLVCVPCKENPDIPDGESRVLLAKDSGQDDWRGWFIPPRRADPEDGMSQLVSIGKSLDDILDEFFKKHQLHAPDDCPSYLGTRYRVEYENGSSEDYESSESCPE